MTSTIEPLVVFDIRDVPTWMRVCENKPFWDALLEWMRAHGLNPTHIYRLEVWLVDCPSARVYEYDLDQDGHRYTVDNYVARRDPYDVILSSLPPEASAVPEEEQE